MDPLGFLGDVAAAWSPTEDLGHVQGGQYGGYLFPMGPFFALGRLIGLEPWLVQRLWLGTVLAFAAWGTVRLLDALLGRRGVAQVLAGALMLLNPYVAVFTARTSVTLLGYAALPWLLLCVHRGLRRPRSWWWPAAFALAVACTGGGVNAAVTAWVLLGPVLLALYEWLSRETWLRRVLSFGWRTALLTALGAIWWVVPTLVQARYGVDFLRFTEQPGTIWSTTSLPESLRLMGYWISYLGVGYGGRLRPLFGDGDVLLFSWPVVIAGLLVPALALTSFAVARRSRHGAFFLALALVGVVAMVAGFPEGTPLRRAMNFTYNHVTPLQFLRTTYKAGPLLALGIACLAGLGVARCGRGGRVAVLVVVLARDLAAGRWCAGRRWTRSWPGTRSPPRGRRRPTTSTATAGRTGGRSCSRASCTPTTTGAGPSTPCCPRWRTAPSPSATRCPTRTCAPSTCCGRSTGSCSSGARCPASSAPCST